MIEVADSVTLEYCSFDLSAQQYWKGMVVQSDFFFFFIACHSAKVFPTMKRFFYETVLTRRGLNFPPGFTGA